MVHIFPFKIVNDNDNEIQSMKQSANVLYTSLDNNDNDIGI